MRVKTDCDDGEHRGTAVPDQELRIRQELP